jgi:nucleoside-diphosphate-sugar epimerase
MLFITGAESFIGRALTARCKKNGTAFIGTDARVPDDSTTMQSDIRDPAIGELMPEGATVVHLAAISRDPDCRSDPRLAFEVNVGGTANVLAAAMRRRAAQIVFASSEWVYGEVSGDSVQSESQAIDVTAIKSEYALTKIAGEQYLRLVSKLPATTVLRFGIVYGPRSDNWSALESLVNSVLHKPEISVGALATARRFIHVEDIVSGILSANGRTGFEIFNLSGDRPISLGEVIAEAAGVSGLHPKIAETNPGNPSIRNPDNAKAKADLRWKPQWDLRSGVKDVYDFMSRQQA